MSRPLSSFNVLRSSISSFSASSSVASCSYTQTPPSRTFTTSTPASLNKRERIAKARAFFDSKKEQSSEKPDYVLGHMIPVSASLKGRETSSSAAPVKDLWPGCRLSRILIHPQAVWNSPVPKYTNGETPKYLIPGLSEKDRQLLFGAVPHVTTALKFDPETAGSEAELEAVKETIKEQEKQTEMLYRIMDLRNADRSTINSFNRQRIIAEFGGGTDCGSSIVQAALLTMQIRGLNEHLLSSSRDRHNRRALRSLIQNRAKHFRYIKRTQPAQYEQTLADLGLDKRAVEGELHVPF